METPLASIGDVFARYEFVSLGLLLVFYVWVMEYLSLRKALWFDELGTVFVASQPTLHALLHAEPPDGQPPLQYLLVRASVGLFGLTAATVRLPALCGMLLAVTTLYFAIRRRSGFGVAILILASWLGSATGEYGAEARPYGLLLGFVSLAYVCWQRAAEMPPDRRGWMAGMVVGFVGAITVHPYGVITLAVTFVTAEAVRAWQRRSIDWPLVWAMLCGFASFGITLWMGLQTRHLLMGSVPANGEPAAFPTVGALLGEYYDVTTYTLRYSILLAACAVPLFGRRIKVAAKQITGGIPLYEWMAAGALALSCCPIWLLTRLTSHYFWGRYGVASSLGIVLCLSYVLSGIKWDGSIPLAMTISTLLLFTTRVRAYHPREVPSRSEFAHTDVLGIQPNQEPIVVASGLHFLSIWWYSPPELRPRIRYLLDHRLALGVAEFMPEMTLEQHNARHSLPMPLDELEPFLKNHQSFMLYSVMDPPQREWLPAELRRRGYLFKVLGGRDTGYSAAYTLYEVHAPPVPPRAAQ